MSNVNIFETIRNMHGEPEGREQLVNAGTIIYSWSLTDGHGDLIDIQKLDDKQVFEAYSKSLKMKEGIL